MAEFNGLVNEFRKFCRCRKSIAKSTAFDSNEWLYPTSNVLLASLFGKSIPSNCPFLVSLSLKQVDSELNRIYKICNEGSKCGGENAFKLLVGEMIDNIYQHSEFTKAFVAAQSYTKQNFTEIAFFDNGITIPGSLIASGLKFSNDCEAIGRAINGLSTKSEERGHGLQDSIRLYTKGIFSQIFIASRNGAWSINQKKARAYRLSKDNKLNGTLVSVRIPFLSRQVNIFEYIT